MNVLMVMPVSRIAMVCIVAHLCIVSVGTQAAFGTERDGVMAAQRSQAQTIATAIKAGYSVALVEKEDISTLAWPSVVRLRSERPPDWMVMRQSTPMRVVRTYHGTHADNIMMISIDALDNEDRGRDRDRIRSLAPGSRLIVCYMPMTASDIENDSMNNLMHLMHGPIRRAVARHESYGAAEQGMLYGIMFASGGGVVACADAIVRRTDDADASVSLPAQEALREVYRAKGQEEYSFYKNMSYEEFVTAYRHMYVTPDFDMYVEDLNIVFQGDQNETTEVSAATLRTAFGRALHALRFPDSQKAKETTRSRHEAVDRMAIRPEGSCLGAVIRRGHHVLVGSIAAPTVKVPSGEKVEMVPIDTIVEGRSGRTRAAAIDLRDAFVPITVSESSIPDIAVGTTVWVRGGYSYGP